MQARCTKHPGSDVTAHGYRKSPTGEPVAMRFSCKPLIGEPHTFSVPLLPEGAPVERRWSLPPPCPFPEHAKSKVIRYGSYGKGSLKRQRYRCMPKEQPDEAHVFTPALPRDHVCDTDGCEECEELRGIHRGETAVARRHAWSTRVVARALEKLADGASYASVSQWAIRVTDHQRKRATPAEMELRRAQWGVIEALTGGPRHIIVREDAEAPQAVTKMPEAVSPTADTEDDNPFLVQATPEPAADESEPKKRKARTPSPATKRAKNTWHIAADWVEAFAPVIYDPVAKDLKDQAQWAEARIDRQLAARASVPAPIKPTPIDRPRIILVDDVPVYGRDRGTHKRSRRDAGYFVLVVAEVEWQDKKTGKRIDEVEVKNEDYSGDACPVEDEHIGAELRLRLCRVMPKSNTPAWRLVFNELGYTPDFVVADAGTGIGAAISTHFAEKKTTFIPSLFHLTEIIRHKALHDTPGAYVQRPSGRELIPDLEAHVRKLGRHSGVLADSTTWTAWWDELDRILIANGLPSEKLREKRKDYLKPMADALDAIANNPLIPVATGGLETLIAKKVKPLLAMRRTSFGNIERTNHLFDLVVASHNHAFDNLTNVATQLRDDARKHKGWTVPLRTVADPRPPDSWYSSLRDTTLLNWLAEQEGLT